MPGTSPTFANQLALLIFNGIGISGIGYNDPIAPLTHLVVALHTADPTSAGNQETFEVNYSPYTRVQVIRTSSGWTVVGNVVSPANNIVFPTVINVNGSTVQSELATYWSIGEVLQGSSTILYAGPLAEPITLIAGLSGPPMITSASTLTFN